MIRALLLALLLAACQEPGLVRTEHDGIECWTYGQTGYVSCQPMAP